ncbi:hypothetical protein ACFPK1_12580 [Actinomycetospora rhizophila]|uniref:Serine/threonine protein kinase n=1 Tax=Actinomycetospora rhizophila TaxID=1416876 RepID=A0ABV9ZE83_9PSEU
MARRAGDLTPSSPAAAVSQRCGHCSGRDDGDARRGQDAQFACTAFEALTGTPAFTTASVLDRQAGKTPQVGGDLPGTLDRVFADALAVAPEERPSSASAIVASLAAAYGDTYRPRAGPGLRRLVVASGVAAAVAVAAAVLTAMLTTADPDPAAPDPVNGVGGVVVLGTLE